MRVYVVSHPEVVVEPDVPVPDWGLSAAGRTRLVSLLALPGAATLTRVAASTERKAVETAQALASCRPRGSRRWPTSSSSDPPQRVRVGDGPGRPAPDHHRAAGAVAAAEGDVAVVSHGGVGTRLCDLLGVPIDRRYDQPRQGSWYEFDPVTREVPHGWRRLAPAD